MDHTPEIHSAEEKEAVLRLSKGDQPSFRLLYDGYHKQVFRQAYMYLHSEEKAADVVQEVFLKIWAGKEKLAQVQEFKNYIFIIARNTIISYLRKQVLHESLHEELELIDDTTVLPDKQLSIKETTQIIREAIDQLPAQQKQAYTLSREKGLSYEEIAAEMQIALPTVKTHISQALKSLRRYLSDRSVELALLLAYLLFEK